MRTVLWAAAFLALAPAAWGQSAIQPQPEPRVERPASGTVLVPDRFLRRWDPVTVFFDRDVGPAKGGPEDAPERHVAMEPAHPGVWRWLNARTLQFRPAEPWPALSRFTWTIGGKRLALARLLDPARSSIPADGTRGLDRVDSLTLTFAEPLDADLLARILTIRMTPSPGLDSERTRYLTPADFTIKALERTDRDSPVSYVVSLRQPIPDGMHVVATLGLAADPGLPGTVQTITFSTADSFSPVFVGCGGNRLSLGTTGIVYDRTSALPCRTERARVTYRASMAYTPMADSGDNDDADAEEDVDAEAVDDNEDGADEAGAPIDGGTVVVDARPSGRLAATSKDDPALGRAPDKDVRPALASRRTVVIGFSASLGTVDPLTARNLVRITPSVEGLGVSAVGDQLRITGAFATDTLYQVSLEPSAGLADERGRSLALAGSNAAWVYWPKEAPFLLLPAGNGTVERTGPQMIPMRAGGYADADVRIHRIDPADRSFWPFPRHPVTTDDNERPPTEGEAAPPHGGTQGIQPWNLPRQIARFGSPAFSGLVRLPVDPDQGGARFGLDLKPALASVAGKDKPGTYLVGVRALGGGGTRQWMRLQVTDLSLTAVEEERGVRFVVTALSDGRPVEKARIRLEGGLGNDWTVVADGETGADGHFLWTRADTETRRPRLSRVMVSKGDDVLVVDPEQAPDRYTVGGWSPGAADWLSWMEGDLKARRPPDRLICHVFTERPIYRPDDPVQIKTYVRRLSGGLLAPPSADPKAEIVVLGPDGTEWRTPVTLQENGSAHFAFAEKTPATGIYQANVMLKGSVCASASFKKEAYRLPRFQVRLEAPRNIPLDGSADIGMSAIYYAGGPAADRPLRWRVTQFPYAFAPKPREGFAYATEARFQANRPPDSTAVIERETVTDAEGRATLELDPTREKTAHPRRYVVEATVTGDDDKTVTNTEEVLALPPFILALKAPRFLEKGDRIPVEVLMVDAEGNPLAGRDVTLRLLHRQWSSILLASDFTDGKPRYRTETVDEKKLERSVATAAEPVKLDLPVEEAGVYIVEIEATDRLGRRQTVAIDLFAAGDRPVTWSRPPAQVFKVTPDKPSYVPGETATLVLESPFQTARALAVVERADGSFRYDWVDVRNGYGRFALPIEKAFMPRLPVHFLLMRGRLTDVAPTGSLDLGRPQSIAATAWIGVKPVQNVVKVALEAPAAAQPGQTVDVTVKLSDEAGRPLSGEVTLWLIDQAVLALAKEAPLDPLPGFIRDRGSRMAVADTRNAVFGFLPLDEDPGGDGGEGDQALLNRVTIRKNFQPVPYYNPTLSVDESGTATVKVALPDNLTVFRLRAKAIAGPDRFGFATGQIAVRLPVVVEPNLPRFVRPGDRFTVSALGRVVEGEGGPGSARATLQGLAPEGAGPDGPGLERRFDWVKGRSQRLEFPVTVPTPSYGPDGAPQSDSVTVTVAVERATDKASDGFAVQLPIHPDRDPEVRRILADLDGSTPFVLPGIEGEARPGTVRRQLLVSNEPSLVRLAAGLNVLRAYPYGCTEQRISRARTELAAAGFAALQPAGAGLDETAIRQTVEWLASATGEDGLVAFWPGSRGSVSLTAWAVEFLVEARAAGIAIDQALFTRLTAALKRGLRSDYGGFVAGDAYVERAWALSALAAAGMLDRGYAAELARRADALSLEGVARVRLALGGDAGGAVDAPVLARLDQALWSGIVFKVRDGNPVYGGLQAGFGPQSPWILPSETRAIAQVLRATATGKDPRRRILADALTTLGTGNGWGSTNADAEAMMALTRFFNAGTGAPEMETALALPDGPRTLLLKGDRPLESIMLTAAEEIAVTAKGASAAWPLAVQSELTWLPASDGAEVAPRAAGFVVTRETAVLDQAGGPPRRQVLDTAGTSVDLTVGDIVEDSLEVVNPEDRVHVAVVMPLAAGMEALNPALDTAPPEALPSAEPTLMPNYVSFLDDRVAFFYDFLPKGTYRFHVRAKAAVPGRFIQPAAAAELMYARAVRGNGAGAVVAIAPAPATDPP